MADENNEKSFSAISDDSEYGLEARRHSPVEKNWSWTTAPVKIVHEIDYEDRRVLTDDDVAPVERLVADDAILFDDVEGKGAVASSVVDSKRGEGQTMDNAVDKDIPNHPIQAHGGALLMEEMNFEEVKENEVIWK